VARIYIGEPSKVDQEVLEKVKELPDDFWVFAEFSIGRNVDWFIVREVPESLRDSRKSTMILTEVKRLERPLRGNSIHLSWEELDSTGQWQEILCSNRLDRNYYWQAVNTANELSRWLWNNSPIFRANRRPTAGEEFKVWPDLLILGSRPDTPPRLPIRPETGYGQWWFAPDEWLRHIEEWFPKIGVPLTGDELTGLAEALHLEPLAQPVRPAPPVAPDTANVLAGFLSLVQGLVQRVETLEARAAELERRLGPARPGGGE
jgi:hypothetical protein